MKDEWLNLAISDDNIVAELLLRLKEFPSSSSSHNNNNNTTFNNPLPPSWGLRQPRSKPSSLTSSSVEKRRETRRSPTTPLSWTCGGAASPSEGCDESLSSHHQPPPSDRFRSKVSIHLSTFSLFSVFHILDLRKYPCHQTGSLSPVTVITLFFGKQICVIGYHVSESVYCHNWKNKKEKKSGFYFIFFQFFLRLLHFPGQLSFLFSATKILFFFKKENFFITFFFYNFYFGLWVGLDLSEVPLKRV